MIGPRTRATRLPMRVVVVAPGNVLIVATLWLLGLAHGVRAPLDRQIRRRSWLLLLWLLWLRHWLRGGANRLIGIVLRMVLPLASRVLSVVFELTAVLAANNFILRARLLLGGLRTIGNVRRVALVILTPPFRTVLSLPA